VYGSPFFPPSRVKLRQFFPIELAFAVTAHKAEGKTLSRVILALSHCEAKKCDFLYEQVHVALSRVKQSKHLRLLLIGRDEAEQWMSISYIDNLRQDPSIAFFFDGYRVPQPDNPNVDWMTDVWSAERANQRFKERIGL
jgi:hypothetical protein